MLSTWIMMLFIGGASADAPAVPELDMTLCRSFAIDDCGDAEFDEVGSLDVDADGTDERVFTVVRGGDEICHVRHACFAVVERHRGRWRVLLSGLGGTIGATGRRAHRDLIVTAANSADEHEHILYRFGRGAYRAVRRRTCTLDDPRTSCRLPEVEVVLQ